LVLAISLPAKMSILSFPRMLRSYAQRTI
jgi:hypothetical protein